MSWKKLCWRKRRIFIWKEGERFAQTVQNKNLLIAVVSFFKKIKDTQGYLHNPQDNINQRLD